MNINFELTGHGQESFLQLTRGLAQRGAKLHRVQHFAIAVRGRVYSRPFIDYRLSPDGLEANTGVVISNVPPSSAKRLADVLRGARDDGSNHARSHSQSPFTGQEVRWAFARAGLPLSAYVGGFTGPAGWKITVILQSGFDTTVVLYAKRAPRTFMTISDQRVLVRRNVTVNYPARSRKLPRIKRALALLTETRIRVSPTAAKRAIQQRARKWSSGGKIVDLACRPDPADSEAITCVGSPVECQGGAPIDRWSVHRGRGTNGEPVVILGVPEQTTYCIVNTSDPDTALDCQSQPYLICDATQP